MCRAGVGVGVGQPPAGRPRWGVLIRGGPMAAPRRRTRRALVVGTIVAALAAGPPGASAQRSSRVPALKWQACRNAAGFQCASASVPKDYASGAKGKIRLALTRLPATDRQHRIGSLFINFGGPGATTVD